MVDSHRVGVVLAILLIILLTPDGTSPSHRAESEAVIEQEKRELDELRNSTYGTPGNITGLLDVGKEVPGKPAVMVPPSTVRKTVEEMISQIIHDDGLRKSESYIFQNSRLEASKSKESEPASRGDTQDTVKDEKKFELEAGQKKTGSQETEGEDIGLPLYANATGHVRGYWRRLYNVPQYIPIDPELNFEKNITSDSGKLFLRIEEVKPGFIQAIEARLSLKDEAGWHAQDILLNGVHFTKSGDMVLTTSSRNFSGIFALPHFSLSEEKYKLSKPFVIESIEEAIKNQENSIEGNLAWPSITDSSTDPRCEYIAYFQLHPVKSKTPSPNYPRYHPQSWLDWLWGNAPITPDVLHEIEKELRHPTGAPLPPAPPIIISGVVYSPTCGFVLEIKDAKGLKTEKYHTRVALFALTASLIIGLLTWLLIRQMNESNTPSTLSRVSFWSMAMMAIVDGYVTAGFIFFSMIVQSSYLSLVTAAFLSFDLVVVFGMRFLLTIWVVQRPERRAQQATAAATSSNNSNRNQPEAILSSPATAATAQTPLIVPENNNVNTNTNAAANDERQDVSMLYSRFYFTIVGGAFLFLHVASWPPSARHIFMNIVLFIASSFWVPQIYRNVMRGCRKALSWEFACGTSICRLTPLIYLFFVKDNIFYYDGDWRVGCAIIGWVWMQVILLAVQEMFGARLFVPESLLPPAYDYHPILPIDDLEAAQPFSASSPTTNSRSGPRTFDCAICMHAVQVPTIASNMESERGRGSGTTRGASSAAASLGLLSRRSYMVTPCRHVFHSICLEGWMRYRLQCPICRNQLPPL